jgi:hypothetical protein
MLVVVITHLISLQEVQQTNHYLLVAGQRLLLVQKIMIVIVLLLQANLQYQVAKVENIFFILQYLLVHQVKPV